MIDPTEFCIKETLEHKKAVENMMFLLAALLLERCQEHDNSKLSSQELPGFVEYTPKLKNCTYGSDEYNRYLLELKPFLNHHYENNRHHPEHFKNDIERYCTECNHGFSKLDEEYYIENRMCPNCLKKSNIQKRSTLKGMTLIDLIEMLCDWKAATLRHADGGILKSIEYNKKRFGISDELCQILKNTVPLL